VETKISRTRRLDFTCSVIATCNSVKKLKEPLLSRFAVIELKGYDNFEEFKQVTLDVLKNHPLAEYSAETVYSSDKPNIRDCVRIASSDRTGCVEVTKCFEATRVVELNQCCRRTVELLSKSMGRKYRTCGLWCI
jgi:hypothetical protein